MKIKNEHYILALIFLLTFGARLYFAFGTENFTYNSYFNIRQVENIRETMLPVFDDELSFSGRSLVFMPFFHYTLAFFDIFLPIDFVAKVIPNLFASLIIIIVFYLSKEITKDKEAALFASFISGFLPIFFIETIISVSVYSLLLPLMILLLYFFVKIKHGEKYIKYFIITLIIATLTNPSIFFLIVTLLIYLIIGKLEHLKIRKSEVELITFSTFIVVFILYLFYKQALIMHGASVIWQNIPKIIMQNHFKEISLLEAIYKIGLIPFFSALYITYRSFFKERNKYNFILVSFGISIAFMLWFKLISLVNGVMFLGIISILLFADFYRILFGYIGKTKVSLLKKPFMFFLFLIIIITSVIPSLYYSTLKIETAPTETEINALKWIRENTNEHDIILSPVKEGFIINHASKRKNIIDSNFILITDASQRVEDIETIYTTQFKTNAIELLTKYNIKYIYLSDKIREDFAVGELRYYDDMCFEKVYNKGVVIYKSLCRLE